jgi:hypothetical protein
MSNDELGESISELMGKGSICESNESGIYTLCYMESDPNGDPWQRDFAVFNIDGSVVLKKNSIYGTVGWHDDKTLVLEKYARVIETDGSSKTIKSYIKIDNEKI